MGAAIKSRHETANGKLARDQVITTGNARDEDVVRKKHVIGWELRAPGVCRVDGCTVVEM